jgi:hypothetical protein
MTKIYTETMTARIETSSVQGVYLSRNVAPLIPAAQRRKQICFQNVVLRKFMKSDDAQNNYHICERCAGFTAREKWQIL